MDVDGTAPAEYPGGGHAEDAPAQEVDGIPAEDVPTLEGGLAPVDNEVRSFVL